MYVIVVACRYRLFNAGVRAAVSAKEFLQLKVSAKVKQDQQLEERQDETYAKMAACAGTLCVLRVCVSRVEVSPIH